MLRADRFVAPALNHDLAGAGKAEPFLPNDARRAAAVHLAGAKALAFDHSDIDLAVVRRFLDGMARASL